MVTTVKGLNNYQKTLIVHIVALDNYTDAERAEHLKALDFCTDGVKHQVLSELERTIKQMCKMTKATKKTRAVPSRTTDGAFADDMADAFKVVPNAIYARINWLKKRPEYRDLISTKKYSGKRKRVKA